MTKKLILALTLIMSALTLSATVSWSPYRIMLDPGHGGTDPGASGPSAPHEATLALRCGLSLKSIITGSTLGGTVKMTRTTDTSVTLSSRKSMSVSYDPYIFCSIHLNAYNGTAHGTETWYYWTTGNSLNLANKVHAELISQMGRTNRGVKRNGWTVITGSSSVPAILTEGLFVDNQEEWSLIKTEGSTGYNNWVNGHLYGFYDHIKQTLGKDVHNPKTSTTTTTDPTLKVSTTSLYFNSQLGTPVSLTFKITATDLSGNITISNPDGNAFEISDETVKASACTSGYTVTVKFKPSNSGYGIGEWDGKVITVSNTTSGTTYTKKVTCSGKIVAKPLNDLTEVWNYSDKRSNTTAAGYDATKIRNFAYYKGKLYCVYNTKKIKVLNAFTGEDLGDLNMDDTFTGGTYIFCDVKVYDGKIYACNLVTDPTTEKLRIYCWDDDQSMGYLLKQFDNIRDCERLGDRMNIQQDDDGLYFTFCNQNTSHTRIVEYRLDKAKNSWTGQYYNLYENDGTTQFKPGSIIHAYRRYNDDVVRYWVDGKACFPTRFKRSTGPTDYSSNGSATNENKEIDTGETWGTNWSQVTYGGSRYITSMVFNEKTGTSSENYTGGRARLAIDKNEDYKTVEQVADYPSDGLSDNIQNTLCNGDVIFKTDSENNTYAMLWVFSNKQGIAFFKKGTLPSYTVSPITQIVPTITTSKTELNFEAEVDGKATAKVTVKGSSLKGEISLSLAGADAGMFKTNASSVTVDEASKSVTVAYYPTVAGTHTATLVCTSEGAETVEIPLTGVATNPVTFVDNIDALQEMWLYSTNRGNCSDAPWFEENKANPFSRDLEFLNGKLYVINAKAWGSNPEINIVNAYTGVKQGSLSLTDISGGRVVIGGISSLGGKIIVSNSAASNHTLTIYKWSSDEADPQIWLEDATHGGVTLGDQMSTSGTMASGKIWFSDGNAIYYYTVTDEVVDPNVNKIELAKGVGTTNGSCQVQPMADGTFWVYGKDTTPTHFAADGSVIESIVNSAMVESEETVSGVLRATTSNSVLRGTSGQVIDFGERTYMTALTYTGTTGTAIGGAVALIDLTESTTVSESVGVYPSEGLGTTPNEQYQSAVATALSEDGMTLNVWTLVPYQGVAYYAYSGTGTLDNTQTGVQEILGASKSWQIAAQGRTIIATETMASIEVYTLSGNLAAQGRGTQLDCQNLPVGIYLIKATALDGTTKVLKTALTR